MNNFEEPKEPQSPNNQIKSDLVEYFRGLKASKKNILDRKKDAVAIQARLNSQVDRKEISRLMTEAAHQAYNLPDSMFLSPEAMAKVELKRKDYQIKVGSSKKILENFEDQDLFDKFDFLESYKSYFNNNHGTRLMIALKDDQLVGYSVLTSEGAQTHVEIQEALLDQPGLGLIMLKEIVECSKDEGQERVSLSTNRIPIGLGNLGFEPVECSDLFVLNYQLDLSRE